MFTLILGYVTAFILTYLAIPAIITVARERKLYDQPNERSSHRLPTPSLGGIGIFGGAICGIIIWTPYEIFGMLQYILAGFVIIFLLGVRDDLLPMPPLKKLFVQLLATTILVYKAGVVITDLWGIMGINKLPELAAVLLSVIIIVGIMNAVNLIDGINGLAGSIGLLSSMFFGAWFFLNNHIEWAVVAFSVAGALTAFLKFNMTPARIFMGDTGSLFVGMAGAVLAIEFVELQRGMSAADQWYCPSAPAVAMSVLILPVYDTMRVFIRRMSQGKSPFYPDRTHIHHMLLDCGLNHTQTTSILIAVNLLFIFVALALNHVGSMALLAVEFALALLLNFALSWLRTRRITAKRQTQNDIN